MIARCIVGVADDLTPAQQAVQAAHAAQVFAGDNPGRYDKTTLVIKAVPAKDLVILTQTASFDRRPTSRWSSFQEPDLGHKLTAVAASGPVARKLARYPLAFRTA